MKTYNIYKIILFLAATLVLSSCSEDKHEPLGGDGTAEEVTDIKHDPLPGGARLTYKLPKDDNLLYVEASLVTSKGVKRYFKASSFMGEIVILGLPDDKECDVSVYSVSYNGSHSAVQNVRIQPLKPPYQSAYESLSTDPTFGGVSLSFANEFQSELAYFIGYEDAKGEFIESEGYYTSSAGDKPYSFRGFESKETKFGFYVKDRWDNISDTLYSTLTPFFEEKIRTDNFKPYRLDNDTPAQDTWNVRLEFLWDGWYSQNYDDPYNQNSGEGAWRCYAAVNPTLNPTLITFDTGLMSRLSRFRLHHYDRYAGGSPRVVEFYGRADIPPKDGSEDGWHKLCTMIQIKPSLEVGNSMSDRESWERGTEVEVDLDAPEVRYIRLKVLESWDGRAGFVASELVLYGQIMN